MAGPWEQYQKQSATPVEGPWAQYAQAAEPAPPPKSKAYSGSFLPFSRDDQGKVSFDSNAGLLGAIKRAVTLPGDVAKGNVDPLSNEGLSRSMEFAGVLSPVNPAIRAGGMIVPGELMATRRANVAPPTAEALKQAAEQAYTQARNMGVEYAPGSVRDMAGALRSGLEQDGVIAELAPKTFGIINKLASPPPGSTAPYTGIEAARRTFGHAARDFANPTEQMAAKRAIGAIDEFVTAGSPESVVAGASSAKDLASAIQAARGNYAAAKRSESLSALAEAIRQRSAASNSGLNTDNTTRQRIASLLQSDRKSAAFNEGEIAALEGVVDGTKTRNALRYVGNLAGGGGGLGAVVTGGMAGAAGGHYLGGPIGAAIGAGIPAVGYGARKLASSLASRDLGNVDAMTRMRSPLFQQMSAGAPYETVNQVPAEALVRALMASASGN